MQIDKALVEKIRLSAPGPVARHFNKRISLPISIQLAKWGVHPNAISVFNMILGVSSGFFAAVGTYHGYLWAGIIFQLASIFDGCDGEVAKLTYKTSKLGEWLDSISDNGALLSLFIGLMIAYAKNHAWPLTVGIILILATGLGGLFWQIIHYLKHNTQSASLATFDKEYLSKIVLNDKSWIMAFVHFGKTLLRKDCFSLLFCISAIFGILPTWIYIAAFGTWITNGVLLYVKREVWLQSLGVRSE